MPIAGEPRQQIVDDKRTSRVGLLGADYHGMRPTMLVSEGARVTRGQALFTDKKLEAVAFTSPVAGRVVAINRGERRSFVSLEIAVEDDVAESLRTFSERALATASREDVTTGLLASGLWPALRTRPYDKLADPKTPPHSIFVNAMDTNPLAADPDVVMTGREADFRAGVIALTRLGDGPVFVCRSPDSKQPRFDDVKGVSEQTFAGPHPAGLVGTHIHFLDPVGPKKTVWHLNYQDVLAIGATLLTGRLDSSRVISLAGPQVKNPRLVRTRLGASTDELVRDEVENGENRVISGSALYGETGTGVTAYLSRYALQVTVLREGRERELLRYVRPGIDMHSVTNMVIGKLRRAHRFPLTTTTNGSARAMVPIGTYEEVMPLDILPTQLLRYLIVGDTDRAVQLGALELAEEDLGLCTYVCPGKYEYGPILRDVLTRIEAEG